LTALLRNRTVRPEDGFQELFRSYETDQDGSKYRKRLAQVAVNNGKSLVIEFDDLIAFDAALARSVRERPDDFIEYASSAATAQMRVEDPEYAEHVGKIWARFRKVAEVTPLKDLSLRHLGKLVSVEGMITKVSRAQLALVQGVYRCQRCLEIVRVVQSGDLLEEPIRRCPSCRQPAAFQLLTEQSRFKDTQEVRISEIVAKRPDRQQSPRSLNVTLAEDLVDTVRLKDKVEATAIVRIKSLSRNRRPTTRFSLSLDATCVGPLEQLDGDPMRVVTR